MTRLTAILALLLVCSPMAQIVKAFSLPATSTCQISVTGGYDIDNPTPYGYGKFYAYKDGCTAKVVEISSQQVVFQLDLEAVGVNTASQYASVTFYRNLTGSDGGWTGLYYDIALPSYSYTVGVITGGTMQVLSETATNMPSIDLDGFNLYVIVTEAKSRDFYIARNNVTTSMARQLQLGHDHPRTASRLWYDIDPAGRTLGSQNTPRNLGLLRR